MTWRQAAVARLKELLICDTRGATAVLVAMTLPAILGLAALGAQVSLWYVAKRNMQGAADAAAYSAIMDYGAGGTSTYAAAAKAVATSFGYTDGTNNVSVTVNMPPKSGNYTSNSSAIEVIIGAPAQNLLATSFFASSASLSARAVAATVTTSSGGCSGSSCGCIIALDSSNATGVNINNGATMTLTKCGLYDNATGISSLEVTGGATLNAYGVTTSGTTTVNNGGSIKSTTPVVTNATATPDPYASDTMPTTASCNFSGSQIHSSATTLNWASSTQQLSPGVYTGGITIQNGAIANMAAGVYIIQGGSFSVQGGATLTGSGVEIVLTSGSSGSYANVNIGNGTTVTLSAPTSSTGCANSGLVFFGDRKAPTTTTDYYDGGATENFTGAIYVPTHISNYSNGSTNASSCTNVVAYTILFVGGSTFQNNCSGDGTSSIGGGTSTTTTSLVE